MFTTGLPGHLERMVLSAGDTQGVQVDRRNVCVRSELVVVAVTTLRLLSNVLARILGENPPLFPLHRVEAPLEMCNDGCIPLD